jgi:hypothetical protein
MKKYKIVVSDNFDNRVYNSQISAINQKEAVKLCLELYALSLDCEPKDITVLEVVKI